MQKHQNTNHNSSLKDFGPYPLVTNINKASNINTNFRTALWTGKHLQVTLMSIPVGGDIGLEIHHNVDQFIKIESGQALVQIGNNKNSTTSREKIDNNYAVIIPAGTWHNVINIGRTPLKLYSIYAPPNHPFGTIDKTKSNI